MLNNWIIFKNISMLFSLEEQLDIELILEEANAYGLRVEVEEYAQRYLSEGCTPV